MIFLFEKDLVEQNLKLPFSNAESCKMGEHGISSQMGAHFISKKYQRGKAMCQGYKDSSEILCLLLFPRYHINLWGDRDLGSLGMKEQGDLKDHLTLWGQVSL